jgi:hypothetical protein
MLRPRFSGEAIAQRGQELHERNLRAQVETEENISKIISIDVETGDYEIDDLIVTERRLQAKHPDAAISGYRQSIPMRPSPVTGKASRCGHLW